MTDRSRLLSLSDAVQRYFDLMYDGDTSKFEQVFTETSQLHGFRDGDMTVWPAAKYKDIMASRPSPQANGAPREEEILLMDFASDTQAMVKVRVRLNASTFIDYLTYHRINGEWLITSKGYHVERVDDAA